MYHSESLIISTKIINLFKSGTVIIDNTS